MTDDFVAPDFVNRVQTHEERRVKYAFLLLAGYNSKEARIMRDYRMSTIIKRCWYDKHPQNKNRNGDVS